MLLKRNKILFLFVTICFIRCFFLYAQYITADLNKYKQILADISHTRKHV